MPKVFDRPDIEKVIRLWLDEALRKLGAPETEKYTIVLSTGELDTEWFCEVVMSSVDEPREYYTRICEELAKLLADYTYYAALQPVSKVKSALVTWRNGREYKDVKHRKGK